MEFLLFSYSYPHVRHFRITKVWYSSKLAILWQRQKELKKKKTDELHEDNLRDRIPRPSTAVAVAAAAAAVAADHRPGNLRELRWDESAVHRPHELLLPVLVGPRCPTLRRPGSRGPVVPALRPEPEVHPWSVERLRLTGRRRLILF